MNYPLSDKYFTSDIQSKIMGPNPLKLCEELISNDSPFLKRGSRVCDLGSGQGVTSVFLAEQYGFKVYAADLWSDPEDNKKFFKSRGLSDEQIIPVKADAENLPFDKEFFDGIVSIDSYNYFGRNEAFLDQKILPFLKSGGYVCLAIAGVKRGVHENMPEELLISWSKEQLEYMQDIDYWRGIFEKSKNAEIVAVKEMQTNENAWREWLAQDNEYAVNDRKSYNAGGGKYLNFISVVLRKK